MQEETTFHVHPYENHSWYIDEDYTRMFLLEGDKYALLIDSGLGTGKLRALAESLTSKPILLANTHGDHDHSGNNKEFAQAYMHPAEYGMYDRLAQAPCRLAPLWEGQRIDLGGRIVEPILIPGHTPGSLAYLDVGKRVIYGGDSVQNGTIFLFGNGRELEAYLASMYKLWEMRESFERIGASHGPVWLEPDFIQVLIDHAQSILAGQAEAELTVVHGTEVRAYHKGILTFLCPK